MIFGRSACIANRDMTLASAILAPRGSLRLQCVSNFSMLAAHAIGAGAVPSIGIMDHLASIHCLGVDDSISDTLLQHCIAVDDCVCSLIRRVCIVVTDRISSCSLSDLDKTVFFWKSWKMERRSIFTLLASTFFASGDTSTAPWVFYRQRNACFSALLVKNRRFLVAVIATGLGMPSEIIVAEVFPSWLRKRT